MKRHWLGITLVGAIVLMVTPLCSIFVSPLSFTSGVCFILGGGIIAIVALAIRYVTLGKKQHEYRLEIGNQVWLIDSDSSGSIRLQNKNGKSVLISIEENKKLSVKDDADSGRNFLMGFGYSEVNFLAGKLYISYLPLLGYKITWPKGENWKAS